MTNRIYITRRLIRIPKVKTLCSATHVLWPPESDTSDARDLLQAKRKQRLPRLALRARLDLVERGLGGRVLLVGVVVIMVVVIMVMVGVVGVDFLDGGRHL